MDLSDVSEQWRQLGIALGALLEAVSASVSESIAPALEIVKRAKHAQTWRNVRNRRPTPLTKHHAAMRKGRGRGA